MKKILNSKRLLLILIIFSSIAFSVLNESFEIVGINNQNAELAILNNIIGIQRHEKVEVGNEYLGSNISMELRVFKIPTLRTFKNFIEGNKAAIAEEMCLTTKAYLQSEKFISDYEKVRYQAKPTQEPYKYDKEFIKSFKEGVSQMEVSIKEMQANKMDKKLIDQMKVGFENSKKELAIMMDSTPNLNFWKRQYPDNPKELIKARAKEYLEIEKTVDYNAKLIDKGSKKIFENATYESQSLKWKAIFRAGKESNDVIKKYAKEFSL